MRLRSLLGLMSLAVATVTGCETNDPYDGDYIVSGPVATSSSLVYLDELHDEVVFVQPGEQEVEVRRHLLSEQDVEAEWIEPTLDGESLLVLTTAADERAEDIEEKLHRFSADGMDEPVTQEVLAPFNAVAQSPDGRHVVLYFSGDTSAPLQNANQLAIVDLQQDRVHPVTLNGFGGRLTDVQFPGQEIQIGETVRNIVVFLAEGEVVLVDMNDPEGNQVAFGRNIPGFDPAETMLRPADDLYENPVLFIRSSVGSDNVAMLTLIEKMENDQPIMSTQVSMLPVGSSSTDFVSYNGEDVPYLITLRSNGELVFTNIETQNTFSIALSGSASRLFLREHDLGSRVVPQLVAWSDGGGRAVHTLDLDDIESTLGRKPHELKIQTGIQQLVQLDNDRVLIGSGKSLYVVDFPEDQVTPLTAASVYDPTSSYLDPESNLLLLGTREQQYVSSVDLETLNPESVLLDDPIQTFDFLPEENKVVVTHGDPAGHMTVLSVNDLSRAASYVEWGFLLEGIFDRK